jgi:hypothetical protein
MDSFCTALRWQVLAPFGTFQKASLDSGMRRSADCVAAVRWRSPFALVRRGLDPRGDLRVAFAAANTPLTSDAAGNVYFGYRVTNAGAAPTGLQSGLARVTPTGVGTRPLVSKQFRGPSEIRGAALSLLMPPFSLLLPFVTGGLH